MTHRRLRTCFTGYYGMNNFGDDLFGLLCSAAANQYWDSEPTLAGPTITGVDTRYTMPRWFPAAVYGRGDWAGKASRLYSFVRAIRGCDVLVMGGGSVIGSGESFRKPLMVSAQGKGKVELAAVGVSIGPFADTAAERSAAEFVSRFSYITVRDRRSYELATRMGLGNRAHLSRDLAGLLPLLAPDSMQPRPQREHDGPVRIGIAPCRYREDGAYAAPEKRKLHPALVAALARHARGRRLHVDVFSLNDHPVHGDLALSLELQEQLQAQGVTTRLQRYRDRSPLDVVSAIGECDAFISARLHGAIVAYLQGVPVTIVDYHPKCNDFADDIGLPDRQRITARRQGEDAIGDAVAAMLEGDGAPTLARDRYAREAEDIFRIAPWFAGREAAMEARASAAPARHVT